MRRSRRPSRPAAVVTAALVVTALLAGCGQSGADEGGEAAEPSPGISIPGDLSIGDEGQTPPPSPTPTDDGTSAPASAPGAAGCADLQSAWNSTNRALVDLSPEHPRAFVTSFREAHEATTSVEPPAEVADAWGTMADYLGGVVQAFEDVDTDDASAVSSAMSETVDEGDTARATSASEEITAFLAGNCGT